MTNYFFHRVLLSLFAVLLTAPTYSFGAGESQSQRLKAYRKRQASQKRLECQQSASTAQTEQCRSMERSEPTNLNVGTQVKQPTKSQPSGSQAAPPTARNEAIVQPQTAPRIQTDSPARSQVSVQSQPQAAPRVQANSPVQPQASVQSQPQPTSRVQSDSAVGRVAPSRPSTPTPGEAAPSVQANSPGRATAQTNSPVQPQASVQSQPQPTSRVQSDSAVGRVAPSRPSTPSQAEASPRIQTDSPARSQVSVQSQPQAAPRVQANSPVQPQASFQSQPQPTLRVQSDSAVGRVAPSRPSTPTPAETAPRAQTNSGGRPQATAQPQALPRDPASTGFANPRSLNPQVMPGKDGREVGAPNRFGQGLGAPQMAPTPTTTGRTSPAPSFGGSVPAGGFSVPTSGLKPQATAQLEMTDQQILDRFAAQKELLNQAGTNGLGRTRCGVGSCGGTGLQNAELPPTSGRAPASSPRPQPRPQSRESQAAPTVERELTAEEIAERFKAQLAHVRSQAAAQAQPAPQAPPAVEVTARPNLGPARCPFASCAGKALQQAELPPAAGRDPASLVDDPPAVQGNLQKAYQVGGVTFYGSNSANQASALIGAPVHEIWVERVVDRGRNPAATHSDIMFGHVDRVASVRGSLGSMDSEFGNIPRSDVSAASGLVDRASEGVASARSALAEARAMPDSMGSVRDAAIADAERTLSEAEEALRKAREALEKAKREKEEDEKAAEEAAAGE